MQSSVDAIECGPVEINLFGDRNAEYDDCLHNK